MSTQSQKTSNTLQLNGTEIVRVGESAHGLSPFVAPHVIYHGRYNTDEVGTLPCNDDAVCQFVFNVTWLGEHNCVSNTLCTTLEENVCGDYGPVTVRIIIQVFRQ